MKLFGKTLKQYLEPIKYYALGCVLIVIFQYTVALPLDNQFPFILKLTQIFWQLLVALSVWKLFKDYNFSTVQLLILGIFYSFLIHGLKISIRYLFYNRTGWYLADRFLYGSFLVLLIVVPLAFLLPYLKKKKMFGL
ncbi:MAG: hypothetical protein V1644_02820 [Candidatus Micrarchaeota archaeon]